MLEFPETRHSLILRLPNGNDVKAWEDFVAIYQPLIYRLARGKGFQDADACEIVQEVMIAVSRAVERWVPDVERGRFRDWLFRIARNLMVNFLTRKKFRSLSSGSSDLSALIERQCDSVCEESALFDLEYHREVFQWATDRVRNGVTDKTWRAFWDSTVHAKSIKTVAMELEMSIGSVHIARSRVMAKLREMVRHFEEEA